MEEWNLMQKSLCGDANLVKPTWIAGCFWLEKLFITSQCIRATKVKTADFTLWNKRWTFSHLSHDEQDTPQRGWVFFFFFPSLHTDTNTPFSLLSPSLPSLPPTTTITAAAAPPRSSSPKRGRKWGSDAQLKARWISLSRCSLLGMRRRLKAVPALLLPFCLLANSTFLRFFWSWLRIFSCYAVFSRAGGAITR